MANIDKKLRELKLLELQELERQVRKATSDKDILYLLNEIEKLEKELGLTSVKNGL